MSDSEQEKLKEFVVSLYTSAPCLLEDLLLRVKLPYMEIAKAIEESGVETWGAIRFTSNEIDFNAFQDANVTNEIRAYGLGLLYCLARPIIDIRGKKIVYLQLSPEYGYCLYWLLKDIRKIDKLHIPFNISQIIFEDDDFYEFVLTMQGADEVRFPQLPFEVRRHFFRAYFDAKGEFTITSHWEKRQIYRKWFLLKVYTLGQRFSYDFISTFNLIMAPVWVYKVPEVKYKQINLFQFRWLNRTLIDAILYRLYHNARYCRSDRYEQVREFVEKGYGYKHGIITDPEFFVKSDTEALEYFQDIQIEENLQNKVE